MPPYPALFGVFVDLEPTGARRASRPEPLSSDWRFMKRLIGRTAVWLSDNLYKPLILWAAGYKRSEQDDRYWSPSDKEGWPWHIEFAVEAAEKKLKQE